MSGGGSALDPPTQGPSGHPRGFFLMPRRRKHVPLHVSLNNRLVGQLLKEPGGTIRFRYDESWLGWEKAIPVSLSLPLREDAYMSPSAGPSLRASGVLRGECDAEWCARPLSDSQCPAARRCPCGFRRMLPTPRAQPVMIITRCPLATHLRLSSTKGGAHSTRALGV